MAINHSFVLFCVFSTASKLWYIYKRLLKDYYVVQLYEIKYKEQSTLDVQLGNMKTIKIDFFVGYIYALHVTHF